MSTDAHPLAAALAMAVPLELAANRAISDVELAALVAGAPALAEVIAAHGDDLLYGGKYCRQAFAALVRAVALLAFAPGGVELFGLHFEERR